LEAEYIVGQTWNGEDQANDVDIYAEVRLLGYKYHSYISRRDKTNPDLCEAGFVFSSLGCRLVGGKPGGPLGTWETHSYVVRNEYSDAPQPIFKDVSQNYPSKNIPTNTEVKNYKTGSDGFPNFASSKEFIDAIFPKAKAIINAEKEYFKKNKRYTENIKDLGIPFEGELGIYYLLSNSGLNVGYYSPKSGKSPNYYIYFDFNGIDALCILVDNNHNAEICLSLGGTNPIKSRLGGTIYTLPNNFLDNYKI
jgi:hypothetical protein